MKIESSKKDSVKLKGKFLEVQTSDKSRVKELVKDWYLVHAKSKFKEIAEPLIEKFERHKVEPDSIIFRDMPTRWGSCTPKVE